MGTPPARKEARVAGTTRAGQQQAQPRARLGALQAVRRGKATAATGASAGVAPQASNVGLVAARPRTVAALGAHRHGIELAAEVGRPVAGATSGDAPMAVGAPPVTPLVGEAEGANPRRAALPRAGDGGVTIAENATPVARTPRAPGAAGVGQPGAQGAMEIQGGEASGGAPAGLAIAGGATTQGRVASDTSGPPPRTPRRTGSRGAQLPLGATYGQLGGRGAVA